MTSPGDRGEFELMSETAVCADVKMSLASRFTAQQFFKGKTGLSLHHAQGVP